MKQIIHAIFLVSGTSIGAGLIALPMAVVNIHFTLLAGMMLGIAAMVYYSAMMLIRLNALHQTPASIVELSREYGGAVSFGCTLGSFYLLSFGLLAAYFDCLADTLTVFLPLEKRWVIVACGVGFYGLLCLRSNIFSTFNSICVVVLLLSIGGALIGVNAHAKSVQWATDTHVNEVVSILPLIFGAFGMQTVCPCLYIDLDRDVRKIRWVIALGLMIPAIFYLAWITCCLKNVWIHDPSFFQKLQAHQVSSGELIQFLCDTSPYPSLAVVLKLLSVFAVTTSAIGIGVGLLQSLQLWIPTHGARLVIGLVPVVINLIMADVFMRLLSFAGAICVVFAILVPWYLLKRRKQALGVMGGLTCLFGLLVIVAQLRH